MWTTNKRSHIHLVLLIPLLFVVVKLSIVSVPVCCCVLVARATFDTASWRLGKRPVEAFFSSPSSN